MVNRKRTRSDQESSSKRIHLDNLFQTLSLDDPEELNISEVGHIPTTDDINSYIVKKLAIQYINAQKARFALIKYYDWRFLVVYYFQRWVLRLFNRFWRRYNRSIGRKLLKVFRSYHQVMEVLNLTKSLTLQHFASILDQENRFEQQQLVRRSKARADREDASLLKDVAYNYWDTFEHFDCDQEMMELDIDGIEDMEE